MQAGRIAGAALIVSALASVGLMHMHPTGHQVLANGGAALPLNVAVHTVALIAAPMTLYGLTEFARRLGLERPSALAGLVAYAFGTMAILASAVMSGFVATSVSQHMLHPGANPPDPNTLALLLRYGGWINRGFTTVFIGATAAAMAIWSLGLLVQRRLLPVALLGLLIGIGLVVFLAGGAAMFDVHGFLLVVMAQAVWIIAVGVVLVARPDWRAAS